MKYGVVIQHGCGKSIFISKETLEKSCAIICSGCGSLISLSLFDSTTKQQLLGHCEEWSEKKLNEVLGEEAKK